MLVPRPSAASPSGADAPGAVDVAVVAWPADGPARTRAHAAGRPCLIGAADPPPTDCDRHEDWVRTTTDAGEVAVRTRALVRHAPHGRPTILHADVVMALPDLELSLLGAIHPDPGRVTPRHRLDGVLDDHRSRTVRTAGTPCGRSGPVSASPASTCSTCRVGCCQLATADVSA